MSQSSFRRFLSSDHLFHRYWTGKPPLAGESGLLLLVTSHQTEPGRPDGHHRNAIASAFSPWRRSQTLATMLEISLRGIVEEHLFWDGERPYIKDHAFTSWQDTLCEVPTLPLLAYAIRLKSGDDGRACETLAKEVLKNSLQPSLRLPLLDDLILREGLHELHMHINGTTEPDLVWLHALGSPQRTFHEFMGSFSSRESTKELLLQVGFKEPIDIYHLLRLGALLRDRLTLAVSCTGEIAAFPLCRFRNRLAGKTTKDDKEDARSCPFQSSNEEPHQQKYQCRFQQRPNQDQCPRFWDKPLTMQGLQDLLRTFRYTGLSQPLLARRESEHPLAAMEPRFANLPIQVGEAVTLARAYDAVARGNEAVAAWLHAYLVVQTRYHQLLVQQRNQVGFDQFQKIPDNKLRDNIEGKFEQRFRQLRGMYDGDLASIEGRFSPGATTPKTCRKIHNIFKGFTKVHPTSRQALNGQKGVGRIDRKFACHQPELRLVAHFIKTPDPGQDPNKPDRNYFLCRHHKMRHELWRKATALAYAKKMSRERDALVGIDACANEMHAHPEVFAPAFRMLRERGFPHCTFHAGEDFMHLLSGIRAVYETLEFLDLRKGDRIGHATALGIDPEVWLRLPDAALHLGEWYDNVVLAYQLLTADPEYAGVCQRLAGEAARLHAKLYAPGWLRGVRRRQDAEGGRQAGTFITGSEFDERYRFDMQAVCTAWKFRKLDPLLACYGHLDESPPLSLFRRREWQKVKEKRKNNPPAFRFFLGYHSMDPERWNQIEKPSPELRKLFSKEIFTALQRLVLAEVKRRGVMLESMPTSNVRISYYNSHEEHHLLEWLSLEKDNDKRNLPRQTVAICTDNPGIFPTTLRNEFCHVYQMLIKRGLSEDQAMAELGILNRNARAYRFGLP